MEFSANLGFLWTDRPIVEAIHAAKAAGFAAVECHWPYDTPAHDIRSALSETGLPMLGLNTIRGDVSAGDMGLAACPGREHEARAAIDQAIDFAAEIGARNVHVMAGIAQGDAAREAFLDNLTYAATRADAVGISLLIEPLNGRDAPGYFLNSLAQAAAIIDSLATPTLKIMFDCYHVQVSEGDVARKLEQYLPKIGHIQFARAPDRGPPEGGELSYPYIFKIIHGLGWTLPLGAEYKTGGDTEASLGWMAAYA